MAKCKVRLAFAPKVMTLFSCVFTAILNSKKYNREAPYYCLVIGFITEKYKWCTYSSPGHCGMQLPRLSPRTLTDNGYCSLVVSALLLAQS